jgi:hypothetical protein
MQDMADAGNTAPTEKPKQYDFTVAGDQIAATLIKAAEDQVTEAQLLLDRTKVLADGIKAQIKEQADMLTAGKACTLRYGMLEARQIS